MEESYRNLIDAETIFSSRQAVIDISVVCPFKGGVKVAHGIEKFPSEVTTSKCCPGDHAWNRTVLYQFQAAP